MKGLGNLMRTAQEMQARMAEAQQRIAALEATGVAGGGLVEVTLDGRGAMHKARIDPSLLTGERAILEDLIVAAHNDAKAKLADRVQAEMSEVTGGLPLPPGFSLPF